MGKVAKIAGPNQTKVCPKCGRNLPLNAYAKGNGMFGKRSICKECDHLIHNTDEYRERRRIRRDERRKNEPGYLEKEKQSNLNTLISNKDSYKKYLVRSAKQRAKLKGIPFNIDYTDFDIPEYCPLLNIKLVKHIGDKEKYEDSPSLDRIIPKLGYIKGNVWIISNRANRIKNNASLEELELLVQNLKECLLH